MVYLFSSRVTVLVLRALRPSAFCVLNGEIQYFLPPVAVDVFIQRGKTITTWIRVRSNKDNHIRLSEYLTKGRLILVDGTLSSSLWKDKNGESQIQLLHYGAEACLYQYRQGKGAAAGEDNAVSGTDGAPVPPADFPQDEKEDLPF